MQGLVWLSEAGVPRTFLAASDNILFPFLMFVIAVQMHSWSVLHKASQGLAEHSPGMPTPSHASGSAHLQ